MPSLLEEASALFKSVLAIITIPLAVLGSRKTNYDRAISLINELSTVILLRLHSSHFVAREEIKTLITTKAISKKISSKAVFVDDVINKVIEKIEETPFISKNERRIMLEKARIIREGRGSNKLKMYVFLKNNERDIIFLIVFTSVIISFFFSSYGNIFSNINIDLKLIVELLTGILILFAVVTIAFIAGVSRSIFQGSTKLTQEAYSKLPSFYDEALKFDNSGTPIIFNLSDVTFKEEDKTVETDPAGCLSFGIIRFKKKHQSYNLSFTNRNNNDTETYLTITIKTISARNGILDIDIIEYIIKTKDKEELYVNFPVARDKPGEIFILEVSNERIQKYFYSIYKNKENVYVYSNSNFGLIFDTNYALQAIEIEGVIADATNINQKNKK